MTTLITNSQFKQFDANGLPLAAGKIYTYEVGTTTDKVTYEDEGKVSAHTNPIILDSWGEATIWIDGDTKFVVTDSDDVTIRTYPSFENGSGATEVPVISSPEGAVYRSIITDVGYLKITLPMTSWPNTKMMFDVMIYTDAADEAFTLTLGGYADSNTNSWLTTTAITNGITDYTVQFGNDGASPAIYIGEVSTSWVNPQVAVSNFFAGQFSYDYDTWSSGWSISVTTSIGTITSTETAVSFSSLIGWGDWQDPVYLDDWVDTTTVGFRVCQYRKSNDGNNIQITGFVNSQTSTSLYCFNLPAEYRPTASIYDSAESGTNADSRALIVKADGNVGVVDFQTGSLYGFNAIIPIT